jgi:hypothetical protein
MLFMPESILPNGSGGFTLVGAPTYANFGSVGGTSAYVYTVNGTTLAVSTPVKVALAGTNDMLGAVALGPGPRFAVKAMTPAAGTPVPSFYVGNVSTSTSALAGTAAPQVGFAKTTFATLDDAPMWDVRGNWRGSELLVSSVSLGTANASGANVYWWNDQGTLRGRASGVTAIGKPRAFKSVSAAFKNPASPTANLWVGGSFPTNASQGTVVVFDVASTPRDGGA